jgi:hypothetical protein
MPRAIVDLPAEHDSRREQGCRDRCVHKRKAYAHDVEREVRAFRRFNREQHLPDCGDRHGDPQ